MSSRAGRRPPAAATTLGFELLGVDPDAGTIEVAFTATDQFLNPVGVVQGGFLAAMLDDTLGPRSWPPSGSENSRHHRSARAVPASRAPGRLVGHGRVVRRGKDVAFLAGELRDEHGAVVAVASATAVIRRQPG